MIDVKPMGSDTWPIEAITWLKTNLEGMVVKLFCFTKTEETYNVCFYVTENDANLNATLVTSHFAESTGNR